MNTATASPATEVPESGVWSAVSALLQLRAKFPPVTPAPRRLPLPVTFAQERVWTLVQLEPQTPVFNVSLAWWLDGRLEVAALERALHYLCGRHESLRLFFATYENRPCARLAEEVVLPLRKVKLSSSAAPARENQALQLAQQEASAPFDLAAKPPVRATLFHLAEARHLLVLTVHQMLFDGWSIRILNREIGEAYRAAVAGRAPSLARLPVQYLDFAHWQREWIDDDALKTPLAFWGKLLAEPYRPLALPWDRAGVRADTGVAGRASFHLPRAQLESLKQLSPAETATPFMLLHAAWTAWLHCHSRQTDLLIFASLASRTQPELQGVIGLVANVLPLRTQLPAGASFRELLRASSAVVAGGLAHQAAPFEKIAPLLRSAAGDASLFQMLLIYQNAPTSVPDGGELRFRPAPEVDNGAAKFDLLLDVANGPDGVRGSLRFRADRFDPETIQALLEDWRDLVEQLLAAPDKPLEQFKLTRLGNRNAKPVAPAPPSETIGASTRESRDGLEMQLAAIWQRALGVAQVDAADDFFELGGHSMRAVQLFTEIEKQLGLRLPIATLFRAPTFGQLARVLHQEGCETRWPSLVPIQPNGTRPPFVWLHTLGGGGGGGLLRYRALANLLGPDQPSFGIEAPHEPFTDIKEMATAYLEMLKTLQPRGPYFLGGYCFAANVAFEMACQLEARGEKVAMLAVLEAMPPEAMHRRTALTRRNLGSFMRNLVFWLRDFLLRPPRVVGADLLRLGRKLRDRQKPETQFRELGEIVDIGHYPAGFRHYAEVHYQAMRRYQPGVYHGRITLFRARTRSLFKFDPLLGWGAHAGGGITVRIVPGKHEDFLEEPLVRGLAEQFREVLNTAQAGAT